MPKRGNSEGSVYRRASDGQWVAAVSLELGGRKVFYARTRAEAHKKLRQALLQRDQGSLVAAPRQTFGRYLTGWLEDSMRSVLKPRSYVAYEEKLRLHVLPFVGNVVLEKLTPAHLDRLYRGRLEAGLSPSSVKMINNIVHRALDAALRRGLVARNAAKLVELPRVRKRAVGRLDDDQLTGLLDALEAHKLGPFWTVMLMTGLRLGEAAALRWEDVSFDEAILRVEHTLTRLSGAAAKREGWTWKLTAPKTEASRRRVPLNATAVAALRLQKVRQLEAKVLAGPEWEEHGLVFTGQKGQPLRGAHALAEFTKVLADAKLPKLRLHDLRHQFATLVHEATQSPRAAQELLGHARIATTMDIYTAPVPQVLRDAAENVDALVKRRTMRKSQAG